MSRVLLVEDNAANRKLLTAILAHAGYVVVAVSNAEEAYSAAHDAPFDLVVTDIQMPRVDGLTLVRRLAANARTQQIPVLAVTALAMRGDEQRVLDGGCCGYVPKPVDYKLLLAEVARILRERSGAA